MSSTPPPPYRNVYLSWQGVSLSSGYRPTPFDVMCGKNPPTITGGYAQWGTIGRYLQRGLTVFQGYSPVQMTCEVIFGSWGQTGWDTTDKTGSAIEAQIGTLEWMAGLNFQAGPSPIVYVHSYGNGGETDLIPPQVRGIPWIINSGESEGLTLGTSYRNSNGYRVWQEATVVLENYLNLNAPPPPDNNIAGGYFVITAARNTALKIAGAPSGHVPLANQQSLARQILASPKNNPCKGTTIKLAGKSINWTIRNGVHVWVPGHIIS